MEEPKYLSASGGFQASNKTSTGGAWLLKGTPEYDQVFFYLKSCLSNQSTTIDADGENYGSLDLDLDSLEVWKIDNPELSYRYERRTKNLLKLACWTIPNELNTVDNICTSGFKIPSGRSGLEFTTGLIDLPSFRNNSKTYTYIYSEIGVGRAFVCDNVESEVPPGFDSLYITPQPLDRNRDGKFSLSEYRTAARFEYRQATQYRHAYFIKDTSLIYPKYVITFSINDNNSALQQQKVQLSRDQSFLYFDPVTLNLVHPRDMNNSHGGGGGGVFHYAERNLIPVDQAFDQAEQEMQRLGNSEDLSVVRKKDWIEKHLTTLEDKVRDINLNYAEVCDGIQEAADLALKKLQALTRSKLETCLSMEIELRRQLEQLDWLDACIERELQAVKTQSSMHINSISAKKLQFLRAWKCHSVFRNSLCRSKPAEMQSLSAIHPDIKLRAELELYVDPFYSSSWQGSETSNGPVNNSINGFNNATALKPTNYVIPDLNMLSNVGIAKPHSSLLIPSPLQNLVDAELEAVQEAILKAVVVGSKGRIDPQNISETGSSGAVIKNARLPMSIMRSVLGGEQYALPLHSILSELDSNNSYINNHNTDDSDGEQRVGGGSLRAEFVESLREAIGGIDESKSSRNHPGGHHTDTHSTFSGAQYTTALLPPPPESIESYRPTYMYATEQADEQHHQYQREQLNTNTNDFAAPNRGGGGVDSVDDDDMQSYFSSSATRYRSPHFHPHQQYHHNLTNTATREGVSSADPVRYSDNIFLSGISNNNNSALFKSPAAQAQSMSVLSLAPQPTPLNNNHHHYYQQNHHQHQQQQQEGPNLSIQMSVDQLSRVVAALPNAASRYSLRELGVRKMKQLLARGVGGFADGVASLKDSRILTQMMLNQEGVSVEDVYLSLPFFTVPPQCRLLYSTHSEGSFSSSSSASSTSSSSASANGQSSKSLTAMYSRTSKHAGPCLLIIKSGSAVFGAYLSDTLAPAVSAGFSGETDGEPAQSREVWAGSPSCYLFSLTLGLKIPFHARSSTPAPPLTSATPNSRSKHQQQQQQRDDPFTRHAAFCAGRDELKVGDGDLLLDASLTRGSSQLEQSYGVGVVPGSPEALCLLTGRPTFRVDQLEVWAVLS